MNASLEQTERAINLRKAVLAERKNCLEIAIKYEALDVAAAIRGQENDPNMNRQTGRTLELVKNLPDDDQKVFIVVHKLDFGHNYLSDMIRVMRGNDLLKNCTFISTFEGLRGISKYRVFVEHTVWDQWNRKDIDSLIKFLTF